MATIHTIKIGQHYKFRYREIKSHPLPKRGYSEWHGQQALVLDELPNCGPDGETMFVVRFPNGPRAGKAYAFVDELIDIQSEA